MSSWLYKLRRKRSCESNIGATTTAGFGSKTPAAASHQKPPPPSPATPPWSPNRASYYFPSRDRAALSSPNKKQQQTGNPKLRDTRFPRSPLQPGGGDIVFDVVARRDDDVFGAPSPRPVHHHQLKLRPIITSRAHVDDEASSFSSSSDSGGGGAKWPTAAATRMMRRRRRRLRAPSGGKRTTAKGKPAEETCSGGGELRWVYESVVVVKESAEPEEDFLASMAEMIAAHGGVRSPRGMEDLLACYLALNAAEHHRAIVAAFRRAWLDSVAAPPPTPMPMIRERCRLHARCV